MEGRDELKFTSFFASPYNRTCMCCCFPIVKSLDIVAFVNVNVMLHLLLSLH
jgi:hypothetical protein